MKEAAGVLVFILFVVVLGIFMAFHLAQYLVFFIMPALVIGGIIFVIAAIVALIGWASSGRSNDKIDYKEEYWWLDFDD